MAQNKKTEGAGKSVVVAGVATAAALMAGAAGAYWLYGSPESAKHRKMAKSFMLKARAEALEAVEKAKDMDKQTYLNIVDGVVARYSKLSGITSAELAQMTRDLKASWAHMHTIKAKMMAPMPAKKVAKKKTPAKKN